MCNMGCLICCYFEGPIETWLMLTWFILVNCNKVIFAFSIPFGKDWIWLLFYSLCWLLLITSDWKLSNLQTVPCRKSLLHENVMYKEQNSRNVLFKLRLTVYLFIQCTWMSILQFYSSVITFIIMAVTY